MFACLNLLDALQSVGVYPHVFHAHFTCDHISGNTLTILFIRYFVEMECFHLRVHCILPYKARLRLDLERRIFAVSETPHIRRFENVEYSTFLKRSIFGVSETSNIRHFGNAEYSTFPKRRIVDVSEPSNI